MRCQQREPATPNHALQRTAPAVAELGVVRRCSRPVKTKLSTSLSITTALLASWLASSVAAELPKVDWRFEVTRDERRDLPFTTISLVVNGRATHINSKVVASFRALQPSQFQQHGVPRNALAACHGWWAGAGDDYYVILHDGFLALYHRELSETADIPQYNLLRRIPIPKAK